MFPGAISLVVVSLTVFVAYVVFGICGFGSTLIAVPLMAHFFPLKVVIPVIVLVDCVASVRQGLRLRAGVNKRDLLAMLPFILVGMVVGGMGPGADAGQRPAAGARRIRHGLRPLLRRAP